MKEQTPPVIDSDRPWDVLASRPLVEDRWLSLHAQRCRTAGGAVLDPFYVLRYPDWVNAVALTDDQQVLLTRQYRHGAGETLLELPSGTVDPEDASPADAMRRELIEETGFHFDTLLETGRVSANPSNHSNSTFCFLATGVVGRSEPVWDAREQVQVVTMPLEELRERALAGEFLQSLHVSSIFFALTRLGLL